MELKYKKDLSIKHKDFKGLPNNFSCNGTIHIYGCKNLVNLCEGDNLTCKDYLRILSCPNFETLPANLKVNTVVISETNLDGSKIPRTIKVKNFYIGGFAVIKDGKWLV